MEVKLDLTKNYRLTLKDLKERLVGELGDGLDSLILYGSIARGDYGPESDIDILVILADAKLKDKLSDIRYDIDMKNNTFTSFFISSPDKIIKMIQRKYPFIKSILTEGKVIYDNGTWAGLCCNSISKIG